MTAKLSIEAINSSLEAAHSDWTLNQDSDLIQRLFNFDNYYHTMAFANAVAWVAHQHDHHPEMVIGYRSCRVDYFTHSVKGLSSLDFICAQAIDLLVTD